MSDPEHARLMVQLARDDLTALEELKASQRISPAIFGFHAQQAVEKALKSWLSLLGIAYPKIHALNELFDLLEDHGVTTASSFRPLQSLTPFGVQFRYEAFARFEEELDRDEVIQQVNGLISHVKALIPPTEKGN